MVKPIRQLKGPVIKVRTWRTDRPHDHCWHDRTLLNEHTDGMVKYRQCCRCDRMPSEAQKRDSAT